MFRIFKSLVFLLLGVLLVSPAYAQGNCTTDCGLLDYSLTSSVLDIDGSVVPDGSVVQLWSVDDNDQIIELLDDTHVIGDGFLSSDTGKLAASIDITPGSYNVRLRVYNTNSPNFGDESTCAFVSDIIAVSISAPGSMDTADFAGGQIPNTTYIAGSGGCSAPSAVRLIRFSASSSAGAGILTPAASLLVGSIVVGLLSVCRSLDQS